MQGSLIFLIVVLGALLAAGWWVLNRRNKSVPSPVFPPYTVRKTVLGQQELAFKEVLQKVMGEDSIIFAKVGLGHILEFPGNHLEIRMHWARVQRRSVDFLVCDLDQTPVLAIKFDANPGRRGKNTREDVLKDSLGAAELPLLIIRPADGYQLEEVKIRIKYALARQDSLLNDDGSVLHDADLEDDEFSDSMLPKLKRWTSGLWETASRRLH